MNLYWWEYPYLIVMSGAQFGAAWLTLGLVQSWGEVAPRWIPLIGGRKVHPLAAAVPAVVGGLLVLGGCVYAAWGVHAGYGTPISEMTSPGFQRVALVGAYVPLAAWGPLVAALGVHHYRRRTRRTELQPA
ncbi:hypothetical protein [Streptomyces profundus]|uniref:hypothetical protein n=1 Tax=Streptomyces profundus TaxID=2867410 RepID=UPI001D161208|nr:hypothetical protein [Streptomyces sp. MA3_2.13]UED85080.1 hypothetical protein K4G22_13455 [Streptomyces sp. MA3_2.13]